MKLDCTYTKEYLIEKIKKIRDFDYKQPQYVRMFITSFVDAVYINKDKKIAVVVNVDNSLFITTSPKCVSHSSMVELIQCYPNSNLMINYNHIVLRHEYFLCQ